MSNEFSLSGAQAKPTRYAPIYQSTFSIGLNTQRNPLRPGKGSSLMNRLYGADNDAFLDGLNVEISNRLTPVRRPGSSVYNSQSFPIIDNFYEFRIFNSNTETIKVIADTSPIIWDATGPSTKTALFTKSAGAGEAYFQSVGNTLYWGDGVDQKKWIESALVWTATTLFNHGDFIIDTNGNIQVAVGSLTFTSNFVDIPQNNQEVVTFDPAQANLLPTIRFFKGVNVTYAGFTNATFLNGVTTPIVSVLGADINQSPLVNLSDTSIFTLAAIGGHAGFSSVDSGTATTGNGTTGSTQPSWATGLGAVTHDAGAQWINHGSAIENWGVVAPTTAPSVTQQPVPTADISWVATTYFSSSFGYVPGFPLQNGFSIPILDGAGNIQFFARAVGAGTIQTGASLPSFSGTPGVTTNDGNIQWSCQGPAAPIAIHAYTLGQWVNATATDGNSYFFRCITPGTSGTTAPIWTPAYGFTVMDGGITWQNVGPSFDWTRIGATQPVSNNNKILDSNGNEETVVVSGVSGSTAPTWSTTQGATTTDNTVTWVNNGPLSPASTGTWIWAYAFKDSVSGDVSTVSPVSTPLKLALNNYPLLQGAGSSDPQVDTIVIYRTVQGGSSATLLEEDEIPNPPAGQMWQYYGQIPDVDLDGEILANIAFSANPPPVGLVKMTYHLGRIWGVVNNSVYFSAGPDATNGNGNEQFPPANVFVFPDQVNRLWATTQGLFVFTVSDVYLISGTTTTSFFSVPFLVGVGLQNYNAWAVNGATVYMFTSDSQVVSLDLGTGVSEVGFPIGDQFLKAPWSPATARLTYHISGSADKGLYVSNFNDGWYRLYPTPAPETGMTWGTKAVFFGGVSQVQSVETAPGVHNLLIANGTAGQILKRDSTVSTDAGSTYGANFLFGSIVLAQPGQLAELVFITTDSTAIGTRPSLSVQLDEITPFSGGGFESLPGYGPDPPQLQPSTSMYSQRFYFSQTQQPAVCRSLQIHVDWGTDTVQNELLSLTLFGGYSSEL